MRPPKVSLLAVLALAAPASAAPAAAPAPRHNPAPTRATTPPPTPAPIKVAAVKPPPAKLAVVPAKPAAPAPAMPPAPSAADELIVEYQRVGHEIVLLQRLRGSDSVTDLWEMLHEIDLDKGLATPDGRANAALTFAALHDTIERRRGVEISKACQDNVITADCQ